MAEEVKHGKALITHKPVLLDIVFSDTRADVPSLQEWTKRKAIRQEEDAIGFVMRDYIMRDCIKRAAVQWAMFNLESTCLHPPGVFEWRYSFKQQKIGHGID